MTNTSVLIAGAGPTGLALACGLRAFGVDVRVVDAAPGPAVTSRALGLQPRGVEVLDRLGALADLPERALAIREVAVNVDGRRLATLRMSRTSRLVRRPGVLISQAEIEACLRARLTELGGRIEWGRALTGVCPATVDGEPARAEWVVGCDGAHSRARRAAGIAFPGVQLGERFLLADLHAELPLPRDTAVVWLSGDDMVAAFPLPGGVWRLMAPAGEDGDGNGRGGTGDSDGDGDGDGDRDDGRPGTVAARLVDHLARRAGITAAGDARWESTFRIHRRLAATYRQGRVLLAGDAAHVHSPFGGQGLNTGLGDAENLAWKLAAVVTGRADPTLLDTYGTERRPVAADVLASTSGLARVVLGEHGRLVRDHVLVPLLDRPAVQRAVWERASQLRISYRRGPLGSPWSRLRHRPVPGDRVPDAPGTRADGTSVRLHAALRGSFAVLAADRALASTCAAAVAERVPCVALTCAGAGPDALVVRPDGHLLWRGTRPAALRTRLGHALGAG